MKNSANREMKTHGELSFPFAIYGGKIPEYIDSYPLHWHDEMEIIINVDGFGYVTVENEKYKLNKGDIIIIPPEILHSISQYKNETMAYFTILFKFSLLCENEKDICYEKYLKPILNHEKVMPVYCPYNDAVNTELSPHVKELTTNCNITSLNHELIIKSHLFAIMNSLSKAAYKARSADKNTRSTHDKLKKVFSYLEKNYELPITVYDAANLCSFSESHFMKIFKQFTGISFTQYLKEYRLEIAARQLLETQEKIIDIAENTGFNNVSYFIRSFDKRYGVPPSAFRKNNS